MLFSYNWLKEYIDKLPAAREVADRLTMSGTEVESVAETGREIKGVVTAEVLSCGKHPNADKLQLCEVRTDKESYQIVCGARNMKPGHKVALALSGAELPGGVKIKKSKIRGVESEGMICSEVELGLKDTSEGIMILPQDAPLGLDLKSYLALNDFMMEVSITPNRADLLSIKGLAREISAVTGTIFKDRTFHVDEEESPVESHVSIRIEPGAPCGRYSARVIEGVAIGPSPEAIKRRLEAHGIRSINNAVDITNYVLLETGQPMHAFDLDKISGKSIVARLAKNGEKLETLDNKTRTLDSSMLVIADAKEPVALAGVMGGRGTEVSDTTKTVLLESAWFDPGTVRRTSRKAGLSTDSSYRFERGVDVEGVTIALDMAAYLINKYAGGRTAKGVIDLYPGKPGPRIIEFRIKRAQDLLGISLKEAEVTEIFKRLGIVLKGSSAGVLTAVPPSYRGDLLEETDLVEEVARLFGYDKMPTTLPAAKLTPGEAARHTGIKRKIKEVLTNSGFLEVINYSFISYDLFSLTGPKDKKGVTLLNPLSEDQIVMRDSLIPTLLENLRRNLLRKNEEVKIFEFAPVFIPEGKLPNEKWKVSGLLYGLRWEEAWNYPKVSVDFYDVKGVIENLFEVLCVNGPIEFKPVVKEDIFHPGKSAVVYAADKGIGVLGEVHPDLKIKFDLKRPAYLFELDIDAILDVSGGYRRYSPLPKFPESIRDIAFIIDENIPYQEIINSINGLETKLIETFELFDVYYGGIVPPGKRSMALRITYRSMERTLTNEEVDEIHSKAARAISEKFKAEIRGEGG